MNRNELNKILNNLPQAIVILDRTDRVVYINDCFESLFGYNMTALTGKDIFNLLFLNEGGKMKQEYKKIMTNKNLSFSPLLRINNSREQTICIELTISNLLHNKNIEGVLIAAKTIKDN